MGRAEDAGPPVSAVVIDASAVLAWLLPTQASEAGDRFLLEPPGKFIAPAVMAWEVGNVLLNLRHRGRLAAEDYAEAMRFIEAFEIAVAPPHPPEWVEALAVRETLSLFDACYLAQAEVEEAGLASRDRELLTAAQRRGVSVWDLQ